MQTGCCYSKLTTVVIFGRPFVQELSSCWDGRPFRHNRHRPKNGGSAVPFPLGSSVPIYLTQCRVGRGLYSVVRTKWHTNPSSRLATIDIGRKVVGLLCPFLGGQLGPNLTQRGLDRGLPRYQVASRSIQPFGKNRHVRKMGGCAPLGGGAGTPYNTTSPGPRPTSVLSGILIHPAVSPEQTWAENWGAVSLWEGELGPRLIQYGLDQGLPPYQVAS